MDTLTITKEMREQLRAPLDPRALSQHPTRKFLTSIKAIYVVERLNDVFGIGQWYVKNKVVERSEPWVIVKSVLKIPKYGVRIEQFGGNDNKDPGDAFKGSCTDALTKIASYLEIGIDVFKGLSDDRQSNKTHVGDVTANMSEKQFFALKRMIQMYNLKDDISTITERRRQEIFDKYFDSYKKDMSKSRKKFRDAAKSVGQEIAGPNESDIPF